MRMALLIMVAVASAGVGTTSPPQVPNSGPHVQKKNARTSQPDEQLGESNKAGSNVSVVKQVVAEHETVTETEQQKKDRLEHSANERGLTVYTELLAILTAV